MTKIFAENSLFSWRNFKSKQQPIYTDKKQVIETVLSNLKPVVTMEEIQKLRKSLIDVENKKSFFFIAGDCAESFNDNTIDIVQTKLNAFKKLRKETENRLKKKVIIAGRIAGQYFKPRSASFEVIDGPNGKEKIFSYKGDGINGIGCNERQHDIKRLTRANEESVKTIKIIKNSCKDLFIAHEGLHLEYETYFCKLIENKFFNLSSHFLWIGDRTRKINEAHIEFFRHIDNPIGLKIGPNHKPSEIVSICKKLNPKNRSGKLVLITRLSAEKVDELLPPLIKEMTCSQINAIWQCDPMHGNTIKKDNIKTRLITSIIDEIEISVRIHREHKTFLSGLHLEMTGENVTECVGVNVNFEDLKTNYKTLCDPRLNLEQCVYVITKFSEFCMSK